MPPEQAVAARPFAGPTKGWVKGAYSEGVRDARVFHDPSWTKEQKRRYTAQFDAYGAEHKNREIEARKKQIKLHGEGLDIANDPPLLRDVAGGIEQGAGDLGSLGLRIASEVSPPEGGQDSLADTLNRQLGDREAAFEMAAASDDVPDLLQGGVRGAARSITSMVPLAATGGGAPLVIGGFAASRANQAVTEAIDANMPLEERAAFVGRAALIEGSVAGAFQLAGLGGAERMLVSGFTREGVRGILKQTGAELVEENVTELLDALNVAGSGIGGPVTRAQALEIIKKTTVQTLLTMGALNSYGGIRNRQQRELLSSGLAAEYGWTKERADGVVDRATRRKGDVAKNIGREIEDEAKLSPRGLATMVLGDEAAARKLAAKDSPSRAEWEAAGLPRRKGSERARIAGQLRGLVEDLDEADAQLGRAPAATEVQQGATEAQQAPPPQALVGLGEGQGFEIGDLQSEVVERGLVPPARPPATQEVAPATQEVAPPQAETAPPEFGSLPAWTSMGPASLANEIASGKIPKEDFGKASSLSYKLELEAIVEGSQEWQTASLEDLRALVNGFTTQLPRAANRRLNVMANPFPEGTDWKTASADDLRSMLAAKAIHPDDRKDASDLLFALSEPENKVRRDKAMEDARAASRAKIGENLEPFLNMWEEGERDPAVLTKGWPKGSEVDGVDFFSADIALEAGVLTQEQYDTVQEAFDVKKEDLAAKRDVRNAKKAKATEDRTARAQTARDTAVIFASGLSRSPTEIDAAIADELPVGVAAFVKKGLKEHALTAPVKRKLIDYASEGGLVFVDSGAFSNFKAGVPADWVRVRSEYGAIFAAVDKQQRRNVFIVAPDLVGDQEGTLKLQTSMWKTLNEWEKLGVSLIVPVQKGEGNMAAAWADATDNLDRAENAIIGVPYNAKAWRKAEVLDYIKSQNKVGTEDDPVTVRLHLLGGGKAKVDAIVNAVEKAKLDNVVLEISGDSLYQAASKRKRGKKVKPEAEPKVVAPKKVKKEEGKPTKAKLIPTRTKEGGVEIVVQPIKEPEAKEESKKLPDKKKLLDHLTAAETAELEALRATVRRKFGQLNSGADLSVLVEGSRIAFLYAKAGYRSFSEFAGAMIEMFGPVAKSHIPSWWRNAQDNSPEEIAAAMEEAPSRKEANRIIDELLAAETEEATPFDATAREIILSEQSAIQKNAAMRHLANDHGITEKDAQERVESVLVEIGREIAQDPARSGLERFEALVDLYNNQPRFSKRTSTSVSLQAYSTPLPLAFAASAMIEIGPKTTLYEPTAGLGALTMAAEPGKTDVNELGELRRAELGAKGYRSVTGEDASKWTPSTRYDRVIANPPFGALKPNVNRDGFIIKKLEQQISIKALDAMKDDGSAALILGANLHAGKLGQSDRIFLNYLLNNYYVSGNYEVSGDLYANQGAKFPVRLILVTGRRAESLGKQDLAPDSVERLESWQAVWSKVEEATSESARIRTSLGAARARGPLDGDPAAVQGPADAGEAAVLPGDNGRKAGSRSSGGGKRKGRKPRGRDPQGESAGPSDVRPGESELVGPEGVLPPAGDSGSQRDAPRVAGEAGASLEGVAPVEQGQGSTDAPGQPVAGDLGHEPVHVKEGAAANERQRFYTSASSAPQLGTLVNRMLAPGTAAALDRLSGKVGNVDAWLASKLGYKDVAALQKGLAAEQIDGVALAINNIEEGRSIIIGDQTGIGKGRQAAALIAYAKQKGYMPVFLTVDPKLFSDMHADSLDIGKKVNPFVIGNPSASHVKNKAGKVLVRTPSGPKQAAIIERHISGEKSLADEGYDAVFMPYSQLKDMVRQTGGSLGGVFDPNPRHRLLSHLAQDTKGVLIVMDESHKAAGADSVTGAFMRGGKLKRKSKGVTVEVEFPGVLNGDHVKGVAYLSATYAKRPETMPLYFKTALGVATSNAEELMNAFKRGGVALQQWAANALATGGEMIRRERDFAGVAFDTKDIAESEEAKTEAVEKMDQLAEVLRAITSYSRLAVERIKDAGEAATTNTESSLSTSEFASVLHNYVGQVLLATKVDAAIDEALASHEKNEATVIVVSNTMGSFLSDYVKENELSQGDAVNLGFGDILERALNKTMRSKFTDAGGESEVTDNTPEHLGLTEEYEAVIGMIDGLGDLGLAASPIDAMHAALRNKGLKTGELTGRDLTVDYSTQQPTLQRRPANERKDKNVVVNAYNSGNLDSVIINSSGSTGLSLHASVKNPKAGQRPRHMIIVQADLNIDVVKQTLGRILRTGMVGEAKDFARYTLLSSPVEAERRPFAVLSAKLASLNANTTADSGGDVKVGSLDFLNKYGDRVVSEALAEDEELAQALGLEITTKEDGSFTPKEGIAKQATGRMATLENKRQAEFYASISDRYAELITDLKEAGEYDLEVEVKDTWDAKLTRDVVLEEAIDANQPFAAGLTLGEYSIFDDRKPMKVPELRKALTKQFGTDDTSKHKEVFRAQLASYYTEMDSRAAKYIGEEIAAPAEGADDKAVTAHGKAVARRQERSRRVEAGKVTLKGELDDLALMVGQRLFVETKNGNGEDVIVQEYGGVISAVKLKVAKAGNPWRPNVVRVTTAVEHPRRTVTFAVSRMIGGSVSLRRQGFRLGSHLEVETFGKTQVKNPRTNRLIFTGNLILALSTAGRGQITNFRTAEGNVVTGLVMPQGWKLKNAKNDPRLDVKDGRSAVKLLSDSWDTTLTGKDSDGKKTARLVIERDGWAFFKIAVSKAKKNGGSVFTNAGLVKIVGDFESVGTKMRASQITGPALAKALNHMISEMGYTLQAKGKGATVDAVARAHGRETPSTPNSLGSPEVAAGARALTPRVKKKGRKDQEGVQKTEVVETIKRLWPNVSVKGPSTGGRRFAASKTSGWYTPALNEIRLREAYDVEVALHELGHHFDHRLDWWSVKNGAPAGVAAELVRLGKDLYGTRRPAGGYKREGFAEFIREYLMNGSIEDRAPATHQWFTTVYLQQQPEEAARVRELEGVVDQFLTQTPEQAIRAFTRPMGKSYSPSRLAARLAGFEAAIRDASLPLLRGMQETGADIAAIGPADNPYTLAMFYARTAGPRTKNAALVNSVDLYGQANGLSLKAVLQPILDQGKDAYQEWKEYLVAKRALVRFHGHGVNPGISEATAQAIVDAREARPGFASAAQAFTDFAHRAMRPLVESGHMTEREFAKVVEWNPVYAPFMRQVEIDGFGDKARAGGKGKAINSITKRGSNLPIHDPIDAMLVQYEKIQKVAMQHDVLRNLVLFYDNHLGKVPALGKFIAEREAPIEATSTKALNEALDDQAVNFIEGKVDELGGDEAALSEALDEFWEGRLRVFGVKEDEGAENTRLTIFKLGKEYKGRENIVSIVIDGKRRFFEVMPDMVPILAGVAEAKFLPGKLGSFVRSVTQLQRLGATGLNPAFGLIRNALRDTLTASVTGDYHFHIPLLSTLRGMLMEATGSEYAARYHAAGLDIAGRVGQDLDSARSLSNKFLDGRGKKIGRALFTPNGLRDILGWTEIGPRLMEFKDAYDYGLEEWGEERHATVLGGVAAKDVTTNFSRAGTLGRQINEVVLFFNAAVQSPDRVLRALGVLEAAPWAKHQERHVNAARTLAKASFFLTGTALLLYFANKDKDWWKELPAHEKWGYFHIDVPGEEIVRVPLPFEAGSVFAALPVAALEEERTPGSFKEAFIVATKSGAPLDFTSIHGLLGNASLLGPMADVASNEDWKGAPIVPEIVERNRLPMDQFGPRTTGLARLIGAHVPVEGGYSPAKIEHLLNGYTGGLYRRVASGLSTLMDPSSVDVGDPATLPIAGTMFMQKGTSRVVGDFYDRVKHLKQRKGSNAATPEEIGELASAETVSRELSKTWKARRGVVTSKAHAKEIRKEAERLLLEAQEKIRAHNKRDKKADSARGLGTVLYKLTSPGAEGGAVPEGVTKDQAFSALRAEARRRGGSVRPRTSSGALTAYGKRLGRLAKALAR